MRQGILVASTVLALLASAGAEAAEARRARGTPRERPQRGESVERGAQTEGGRGFFMVGGQSLDLGDLNARLADFGYPRVQEGMLTLGGGGWAARGPWLIGGEGQALVARSRTTSDGAYRRRFGGGYGLLDVGYRVYSERGLDLYPMLGIGGGAMMLDLVERSSPSFDEVLEFPGRSAHLSAGVFAVALSLGLDAALGGRRTRAGSGGLDLGARVGWLFTTTPDTWRLEQENDVSGAPDVSLSGPFMMVMIGGWGSR